MTKEEYRRSISTGELQLNFWGKVSHFRITIFLLFVPIMLFLVHVFEYLNGNSFLFKEGEIYLLIVPAIFSFFSYLLQKRRLKFKIFEIKVNPLTFKPYLEQLCEEWEWIPHFYGNNILIAKTKPGTFSGNTGEQITVIRTENRILINSITDPEKRPPMSAFEDNIKNVEAVVTLFENVNKLPKD